MFFFNFIPGLQSAVCILPSVCILPPVCSLRFTLTIMLIKGTCLEINKRSIINLDMHASPFLALSRKGEGNKMYCIDVGKYVITEWNKIQCPCFVEVFFTIFETDDILNPAQDDQCVEHMTSLAQCVVCEHSTSYSRGILSSAIKHFQQHRMPSLTIQA